jgi:hypothetical protein
MKGSTGSWLFQSCQRAQSWQNDSQKSWQPGFAFDCVTVRVSLSLVNTGLGESYLHEAQPQLLI